MQKSSFLATGIAHWQPDSKSVNFNFRSLKFRNSHASRRRAKLTALQWRWQKQRNRTQWVGTALGARRLSHLWHKQSSLESWEEMCERSPLFVVGGGGCSAAANGLHADGIVTLNCWVALCECIRPSKVMRGFATESAAAEMHSNALLCSSSARRRDRQRQR